MKRLRPGQTPPIVFVFIGGAILLFVILAIAISSSAGKSGSFATKPSAGDHSAPEPVNQRVVTALKSNDSDSVYSELSPSLQQSTTVETFRIAENEAINQMGKIIKIEILEKLTVLTGAGWDGQWAQSKLRITREKTQEVYVARYYLENGKWYLVATIKVQ